MNWFRKHLAGWLALVAIATGQLAVPAAVYAQANPTIRLLLGTKRVCNYPTASLVLRLDASDLTTLYTDIAGTTPVTADGDPVGRWTDKAGGSLYVAASANGATRPTWRYNGGHPYIEFDGGDFLQRAVTIGLYAAGSATIMVAVQDNQQQQGTLFSESLSTSANDIYDLIRNNGTVFNDATGFIRDHGNNTVFTTTVVRTNAFPGLTSDTVYTVTDDGSNIVGYSDKGAVGSSVGYTRGASTFDRFAIGSRYAGAAFTKSKIYGMGFWTKVLSGSERFSGVTCLGLLQGRNP